MWSRRRPLGRRTYGCQGPGEAHVWTYKGHSVPLSMMRRDVWQGLEREPLLWMGGCYQEALRHTNTVRPKKQVSRVSYICGILANALETEPSKAKGEEWGPWAPLSLGLNFRDSVCTALRVTDKKRTCVSHSHIISHLLLQISLGPSWGF